MLTINNNSVVCPVVLSATGEQITDLQNYLHTNGVELIFKADKCTFVVLGIKTIKVPQKCLKSFENLCTWICERINKELSNIK